MISTSAMIWNILIFQKVISCLFVLSFFILPFHLWNLWSTITDFGFSKISYKWDDTVCGVLYLPSFTEHKWPIQAIASIRNYFLFKLKLMDLCNLFIYSTLGVCLVSFLFFFIAIMNKAYLTMYKSLYGYVFLLLLGKFLEMKLLGSVKCLISMYVTLLNLKLPSWYPTRLCTICGPSEFQLFHMLTNTVFSGIFNSSHSNGILLYFLFTFSK